MFAIVYIQTFIDSEEHPVSKNFSQSLVFGYLRHHNVYPKKQ